MSVDSHRIAYVVNHVAFFVSHRLPLAVGARQLGFEVALFTGQAGSPSMERTAEAELAHASVPHQRVAFRSASVNPLLELCGLIQLTWLLWCYQPHLVHCASPKGVLYGGLAARICGTKGLVLAVSGMGYAFTGGSDRNLARVIVRRVYTALARFAFRHRNLRVIVQNMDDRATLIDSGLVCAEQLTLIPGSGVRLADFVGCSAADKERIVLLPARMLRDKGVEEFVAAASKLRQTVPDWRFVLAGAADYQNPTAVSAEQLDRWQQEGLIEWLGHVDDMAPLFAKAAIVCLPSYREGMPKALLEAAAAACAVVTTDVTGCREAVSQGVTGDLVPVRDSEALAKAILSLINDPQKRLRYGAAGRQCAIDRFAVDAVMNQTLAIYKQLLKDA
jgi:glycosyltransferase involved in cell wall biosynthesis